MALAISACCLLLAAQGAVAETAGDYRAVCGVEPGRFHAKGGAPICGVHLIGAVCSAAAERIEMAQPADLFDIDGGAAGVGSGFPHPKGRGRTAADNFKGEAIRGIKAGHSNGGFVGKGLVGLCRKIFSLAGFRRFSGILDRGFCGIGGGARRVFLLPGIRIRLLRV